MATPQNHSADPIVSRRRGPRYGLPGDNSRPGAGILRDEIALTEFREHTKGLSGRLRMPSVESMRAGTVLSPHGLVRRYLLTAKRHGVAREWGLKFAAFVQRTVDFAWPVEATSLRVLEERALAAEARDDLAEKRNDLEGTAITLRERIQSQTNEIVADQLCLAALERKMEAIQ